MISKIYYLKYFLLITSLAIIFQYCENDNLVNPSEPNTDWESGLGYNESYRDSVLFSSNRNKDFYQRVYIMYKDGSGIKQKTSINISYNAEWSPKKRKILYLHYSDTSTYRIARIYIMNADGSNNNIMSSISDNIVSFKCSPDDKKIAYININRSGYVRIKLMNVDGSNQHSLIDSMYLGSLHTLTWSPDSKQIAYDGYAAYRIGIIDSTGKNNKELIDYGLQCWEPTWSPDGIYIAFVAFQTFSKGNLYLYYVPTKTVSQLTSFEGTVENPTWSPDNQGIIFSVIDSVSRRSHLYYINKYGSGLTQLTNDSTNNFSDQYPEWR